MTTPSRVILHEDENMVETMERYVRRSGLSTEPDRIFIHGCNCQGVMGRGIARQIRIAFPCVYDAYTSFIKRALSNIHQIHPNISTDDARRHLLGKVSFVKISPKVYVANCFTQFNYGRRTDYQYLDMDALESCLEHVNRHPAAKGGVHFPSIGAGLAGGDWSLIVKLIQESFPITVPLHHYLYQLSTRSDVDL